MVTLPKATSGEERFSLRRCDKRIVHATGRGLPEIDSVGCCLSRACWNDREKKREQARGAPEVRVHAIVDNVFILCPFRMESPFISRPVSSHAGTNPRVRCNKISLVTQHILVRCHRTMGAFDQWISFRSIRIKLVFYLDSFSIPDCWSNHFKKLQ